MNATFESLEDQAEIDFYQEIETLIKKNPWAWQSVLAVVGLTGGVIAPILGAISDVITWFVYSIQVNSYLHVLSIVLCALTLPLLILGAFCLDLLEAQTSQLSPPASPSATPATATRQVARQNDKHRLNRNGALVVLLFLLTVPMSVDAQQSVLNAPITDVLPPCKVFVEPGVSAEPDDSEAKPNLSSSTRASPSPSESESPQRAKLVLSGGEFPRKEYLNPLTSKHYSAPPCATQLLYLNNKRSRHSTCIEVECLHA